MAIQHGIVEMDSGKLFIGGISWDTDEYGLKSYFTSYGEVIEAVIMRDRITHRSRGFGFVVFADPAVAQTVVMEKHMIDGRTVEAKKAVPREDHHGLTRNSSSVQRSPGYGARTKKIFVGGLASTVTESDFKKYFAQFGGITDVVVMYDHNTQRPRGFGFVTFDSEEEVDRVLVKPFHELNGKMVEVKRAVPKELSPTPNRSPLVGFNCGLTRPNSLFTSTFPQGYSMGPNDYGGRNNSQLRPIGEGRTGFSPFGSSGYGMSMNIDLDLSPGEFKTTSNNTWYGRVLSPYFGGNSNRYITPIGYNQTVSRNDPFTNSLTLNVWGNNGLMGPGGAGAQSGSGSGGYGEARNWPNWGLSPIPTQDGMSSPAYNNGGSIGPIGVPENNYGVVLGRNGLSIGIGDEGSCGNLYLGGSMFNDPTWQSSPTNLDGQGPGLGPGPDLFSYGIDNSEDVGNYSIGNRQTNRGIAT